MSSGAKAWLERGLLALVVVIGLLAVVPAPYSVVRAMSPIDARTLPQKPALPAGADGGELLIPVVDVHRAKWIEAVVYRATGWATLEPIEHVEQASGEHGFVDSRELLRASREIGTLLAADAADVPAVSRGGGVRVHAVGRNGSGSPLRSGDVIVEVDGAPVKTFADLEAIVSRTKPGTRFTVQLRDGRSLKLPPVDAAVFDHGRLMTPHALGMAAVETAKPGVKAPPLRWRQLPSVGGTSSGLALALVAWERLAGEPLAPGKVVYVTGEVSSDGGVYGVGGVEHKADAARRAGADVLVVPSFNENVAREFAGDVDVIAVSSFEEALAQLRGSQPSGDGTPE